MTDALNTSLPEAGAPSREALCRLIHETLIGSDADELIHHPAAKSWEPPTEPRWKQWGELADAVIALYPTPPALKASELGEDHSSVGMKPSPTDETGGGADQVERISEAVRRLSHHDNCVSPADRDNECSCGLYQVLALLPPAQHEVGKWQPINEDTPRDGTHILLSFGQDHVSEGWWEDDDSDPRPWKFIDSGCFGSTFKNGELINGSRDEIYGPSHWQPMPAAWKSTPVAPEARATAQPILSAEGAQEACAASDKLTEPSAVPLSTISEGWRPEDGFKIGQPVEVADGYAYQEWRRIPLFICEVKARIGSAELSYSVSENWPPKGLGDITTDFAEIDLQPRNPAPAQDAEGEG